MKKLYLILGLTFFFGLNTSFAFACTEESRDCPDGSTVGRDNKNDCKFKPCPQANKKLSTIDCKDSEDGCLEAKTEANGTLPAVDCKNSEDGCDSGKH